VVMDNTPGTIISTCAGQTKAVALPPAATVNIDPTCTYELVDDKADLPKAEELFDNLQIVQPRNIQVHVSPDDLNILQQHFRSFSYIYLLVFGSLFVVILGGGTLWIACKLRKRRNRYRTPRRSQDPPETRILLQPIMARPYSPIPLTPPRFIETNEGIRIE
jgi:hypothetical protein